MHTEGGYHGEDVKECMRQLIDEEGIFLIHGLTQPRAYFVKYT